MTKYTAKETMTNFEYQHLKPPLRDVSEAYAVMAQAMMDELDECHERDKCIDKLLEAKDCAVRAKLRMGFPQSGRRG